VAFSHIRQSFRFRCAASEHYVDMPPPPSDAAATTCPGTRAIPRRKSTRKSPSGFSIPGRGADAAFPSPNSLNAASAPPLPPPACHAVSKIVPPPCFATLFFFCYMLSTLRDISRFSPAGCFRYCPPPSVSSAFTPIILFFHSRLR